MKKIAEESARTLAEDRKSWPRDKVVIHQVGRAVWAPSLSPFPLK